MVVTTAVKLPAAAGVVENVTVREVGVADVTVPTALLLNVTELFARMELKPKPAIVTLVELAARLDVLAVTTGVTFATCKAAPLLMLLVVTTAVKLPADVGLTENVTVKAVAVALVTAPTAPLLKTTVLFALVVSNPNPLMTTVAPSAAKSVTLLVIAGVTVAT